MEKTVHERKQSLPGVRCVASNCRYHKEGNQCGAPNIEIRPKNATKPQDTDCATFILK